MDNIQFASGDNTNALSPRHVPDMKQDQEEDAKQSPRCEDHETETVNIEEGQVEVTPQMIEDNEANMKERIAQCKHIIESLKIELIEEKAKLEKQSKNSVRGPEPPSRSTNNNYQCVSTSNIFGENNGYTTNMYSECVDNKLNCDENLMEYEKQLKKYQTTLNLAQVEKKNAIKKQMLAKAYRLKLLEVENQCNIELLRVKQSLQCLEPLQMIASKWKTNIDEMYDVNSFELIPRYPELNANSSSEIASYELEIKEASERFEAANQSDSVL